MLNETVGPMQSYSGNAANHFTIAKTPRLTPTGAFSVVAWAYAGNLTNASDYAVCGSGTNYPNSSKNWQLWKPANSGGQFDFAVGDGSSTYWPVDTTNTGSFAFNALHLLIGINLGGPSGGLVLWDNGRRSHTWPGPAGAILQNDSSIQIGTKGQNQFPWLGAIGEIRMYSRALSDSEAYALWEPSTRWDLYLPVNRFWALKASSPLVATVAATSTLTARLTGTGTLAATVGATSTLTAQPAGTGTLAAALDATSTVTAQLTPAGVYKYRVYVPLVRK
jgi:hypothetical protein